MKRFFLFFIALLSITRTFSHHFDLKFHHLTAEDGLSQTNVTYLRKDYKGFTWICTQNGLNKFDGYKTIVYKHSVTDSTSISSNDIRYVYEDSKRNLWICTADGLDLYDREKDCFKHINFKADNDFSWHRYINTILEDSKGDLWIGTGGGIYLYNHLNKSCIHYGKDPANERSLSDNLVSAIWQDKHGNIWVGTYDKLNLFDRKSHTFKHYGHEPGKNSLSSNDISSIIQMKNGDLAIGTRGGGLNIYNFSSQSFKHFKHDNADINSIGSDYIFSLFEDSRGNLWIGAEHGGINLLHAETGTFSKYKNDIYDPMSILNNSISCIYVDQSGILWAGTHNGGVSYCNPYESRFRQYRQELNRSTLSHNNVRAFAEDANGDLWIGTDGGGLNVWNRKDDLFRYYRHQPGKAGCISSDIVLSLLDDGDQLWIGTYQGGLNRLDKKSGKFTYYKYNPDDPQSISNNTIWSIAKDDQGNLWLATRDGGACMFNPSTQKFTRFKNDTQNEKTLSNDWTICAYKDSHNDIWIGTYRGLNSYDRKSNTFIRYIQQNDHQYSNQINNICEDSKGNIWVATPSGLNLLNKETKTFTLYIQKNGLSENLVQSIEEDSSGNLWIATLNEISKFDPLRNQFKNYHIKNEFLQNVHFRTRKGEIVFGGTRGFNIFLPDKIQDNTYIPPVYFTDFQIFNKSVGLGMDSPLNRNINEIKEITLSYKQSVFSFEFAALNYISSEKNQYAYKMEGFDRDWNYIGNRRTATYTNLDPGIYLLKVKASNNDGVWNETGTSVKITILPPWWMTWWFRAMFLLVIVSIVFVFYYNRLRYVRARNLFLEKEVRKRTAELDEANKHLAHLNSTKDKFFSIIGHDLKGPVKALTFLTSMLKEQPGTFVDEHQQELIDHIHLTSDKIQKLIISLLEWARIQTRQVMPEPSAISVSRLLEENLELLSEQALLKGITIRIKSDAAHMIWGDYNMLSTILRNLLSNSIKYTYRGGTIVMSSAKTSDGRIRIAIADNGIGMTEEMLKKIFSLDKRASVQGTESEMGTGLGLIISREFAELNRADLFAESIPEVGSTFYLVIPAYAGDPVTNHAHV